MYPVYHRFGEVPPTFLVFTYGETPVTAGRHVSDTHYAFHVEKVGPESARRGCRRRCARAPFDAVVAVRGAAVA